MYVLLTPLHVYLTEGVSCSCLFISLYFSALQLLNFSVFWKQQTHFWVVLESEISADGSISEFFATCSSEGGITVVAGSDEERSVVELGTWWLYHFHCHTNGFSCWESSKDWKCDGWCSWAGEKARGQVSGGNCVGWCIVFWALWVVRLWVPLWLSVHTRAYLCFPCARRSAQARRQMWKQFCSPDKVGGITETALRQKRGELSSGSPRPLSNLFHAFGLITHSLWGLRFLCFKWWDGIMLSKGLLSSKTSSL